jgi:hypothetical protein
MLSFDLSMSGYETRFFLLIPILLILSIVLVTDCSNSFAYLQLHFYILALKQTHNNFSLKSLLMSTLG